MRFPPLLLVAVLSFFAAGCSPSPRYVTRRFAAYGTTQPDADSKITSDESGIAPADDERLDRILRYGMTASQVVKALNLEDDRALYSDPDGPTIATGIYLEVCQSPLFPTEWVYLDFAFDPIWREKPGEPTLACWGLKLLPPRLVIGRPIGQSAPVPASATSGTSIPQ